MKKKLEFEEGLEEIVDICLNKMPEGGVFLLKGELGSGKTAFVRRFCRRFGIESVMSPSFNIAHIYKNNGISILHADLYRISDVHHLNELNLYEMADGCKWTFIEWPELIIGSLQDYSVCTLEFTITEDEKREVEIKC